MSLKRPAPDSPGTPSKKARKVLTLAEKMEVITAVHEGLSNRAAAIRFGVGRTQVNNIIGDQQTIEQAFRDGTNTKVKYLVPRTLKYSDIDKEVYDFFLQCREKNIPVSGGALQRHALISSLKLGHNDFTASNGWLDSFTYRHQLKLATLHGESADVDPEVCAQWREKLPEIMQGYKPEDIYNCDECGISMRSIPTRSLIRKGEKAGGTKSLKERFTVLFTASATGHKEKMWVIGKAKKPRSFPSFSVYQNAFVYRNNTRAWMTSSIFQEYVNWLNNKMKAMNRHILLFLDNCPAHPPIEVSNVKLVFLPKNTTAHLQPLDQGIIAMVKSRYKRHLMGEIYDAMQSASDVTSLAKAVTIWDAVVFVKSAWEVVPSDSIIRCFKRCGMHPDLDNLAPIDPIEDEDPGEVAWRELLEVPWDEYLAYDLELDKEAPCRQPVDQLSIQENDKPDDTTDEDVEPSPTIAPAAALKNLKDLQKYFLDEPDYFGMVNRMLSKVRMDVVKLQVNKNKKQSSITNFFQSELSQ